MFIFVSKYTGICTKIFNVFNVLFKELTLAVDELTLAVDAINYIHNLYDDGYLCVS